MKITLRFLKILLLITMAFSIICACTRRQENVEEEQIEEESSNVIKDYVQTPIKKARQAEDALDERNKRMVQSLAEVE